MRRRFVAEAYASQHKLTSIFAGLLCVCDIDNIASEITVNSTIVTVRLGVDIFESDAWSYREFFGKVENVLCKCGSISVGVTVIVGNELLRINKREVCIFSC